MKCCQYFCVKEKKTSCISVSIGFNLSEFFSSWTCNPSRKQDAWIIGMFLMFDGFHKSQFGCCRATFNFIRGWVAKKLWRENFLEFQFILLIFVESFVVLIVHSFYGFILIMKRFVKKSLLKNQIGREKSPKKWMVF